VSTAKFQQPPGGPRSVVAAIQDSTPDGRDGARPSRKIPAHPPLVEVDNRTSLVFLTVCSQGRCPIFARQDIHELLVGTWRAADAWLVGHYVVMPNHLHLFCTPAGYEYPSLIQWVRYWKSAASRRWPRPDEQPVWQKSCWDNQLRRDESYSAKWDYVRNNPVRAGLCLTPDEWPFQGELHEVL
jgi:putative transposase